MGKRIFLSVACGWLLFACRTDPSLTVEGGGAGLLLKVEGEASGSQRAMGEAVRLRLEAEGFPGARVEPVGEDQLRVSIPGLDEAGARRAAELLLQPMRVAVAAVDDAKEFFEALKGQLPSGGQVELARDGYGASEGGELRETWYLRAASREGLDEVLRKLVPPAGRRLAVLPGREGPLAYLIHDPPAVDKAVMERVQVFDDPASGLPMVAMVLAQPFRGSFADITRSQLGRRLAILVNGEIRSLPVVQSVIESGSLRMEPSPVADPKQARPQAEALASGLNAWALARRLTLVRQEVTGGSPPATP